MTRRWRIYKKAFRVTTVKMIKELRRRMDVQSKKSEVCRKYIEPQRDEYNNGNKKYTRRNQQ